MNTASLNLHMYEALVDAGVKPELAREVERQVETTFQAQQDRLAKVDEQQTRLMTTLDGETLRTELKSEIQKLELGIQKLEGAIHDSKADMLKIMNDQTWKLVTFVVVFNTLLVGAIKFLP